MNYKKTLQNSSTLTATREALAGATHADVYRRRAVRFLSKNKKRVVDLVLNGIS